MIAPVTEAPPRSAECTLAQRPEYKGLHGACRQTEDVPLPHASGILLQRRCGCSCHRRTQRRA
ncbi:hypothetical protein [Streptomyces sp. NPDC050164]|uniref:hypothetical protein n=1 Tax=Streptomyces sp. NPDC050164 TaxID=3365605 RepID=UPI00379A2C62